VPEIKNYYNHMFLLIIFINFDWHNKAKNPWL